MPLTANTLDQMHRALTSDSPEDGAQILLDLSTRFGPGRLPDDVCELFVEFRHERLPRLVEAFLDLEQQVAAFPRNFYVQAFARMMPGDIDRLNSQLETRSIVRRAVMLALQGIPPMGSFPKGVVWLMRAIAASDQPCEVQHLPRDREAQILRDDVAWTLTNTKLTSAGAYLARIAGRAPVPLAQESVDLIANLPVEKRRLMGWSLIGHSACHLSPEVAQLLLPDLRPESVRNLLAEMNDDESFRSTLAASSAVDCPALCSELLKDRRASRALLDWVVSPTSWLNPSVPERLAYFFNCGFHPEILIRSLADRAGNVLLMEPQDIRIDRLEFVVKACNGRIHEIGPALVDYSKHYPVGPTAEAATHSFVSMPQMFPTSNHAIH